MPASYGGASGSSGPTTPASALLDAANPGKIVGLAQGTGVGTSFDPNVVVEAGVGIAAGTTAGATLVGDGTQGAVLTSATISALLASADAAAALAAIGAAPGATVADDPGSATGWTTTPSSGVTVSRAGAILTITAAPGATGLTFVTRNASPLGASSTEWEFAVRLDVTAGDGMGAPRGFALLGFYTDANNFSLTTLRSDRYVGLFVNAAGSLTNVAEVVGPSSGDLTGGQFWLRNTRCDDGRFVAWWGVGVGGELPTLWKRIGVRDDNSLPNALGTTTTVYVGSGAYGEGAIGSAWTVDVLAIRTSWRGAL